jgi:long-chain fatty acid transport protein
MKFKLTLLAATMFIFVANAVFAQNGTKFIGYDAKTLGRGGTATGFFNNNTVLQTNPAGMSFLKSSAFELGASAIFPKAHFKNNINDADGESNVYPMGTISYVCKPTGRLSYGAGIFTEGGAGADFKLKHELYKDPVTHDYILQNYHSKFMVMEGGGSVAYKLNSKLSIGATAQLVYSQLEFGAPLSLSPTLLKGVIAPGYTFGNMFGGSPATGGLGYSELTTTASNSGLVAWGFSGKLGVAYKASEKLSFGLNYTSPTSLAYKNGYAVIDLNTQFSDAFGRAVAGTMQQYPGMTQAQATQAVGQKFASIGINAQKGFKDTYAARAKMILPQSIAGGVSATLTRKFRMGLDVEWVNWANAFSALEVNLSNGTNNNISRTLGTKGTVEFPFPLLWKNTVVIRTGGEYVINDSYVLRAGYMYGNNPIPGSTVFPDFPAVIEHHATVGGSVKLKKDVVLNLAYEHGFNKTATANSTSLLGSQYDNSQTSLSVNVFHASISWNLK